MRPLPSDPALGSGSKGGVVSHGTVPDGAEIRLPRDGEWILPSARVRPPPCTGDRGLGPNPASLDRLAPAGRPPCQALGRRRPRIRSDVVLSGPVSAGGRLRGALRPRKGPGPF